MNVSELDFKTVTMEDIKKEILNVNVKKSSSGSISVAILKQPYIFRI